MPLAILLGVLLVASAGTGGGRGEDDQKAKPDPAKSSKPGAPLEMAQLAQMGEDLIKALKATPGCLGVDRGQMSSGKFVIFAFFENKKAAARWYYSPAHQRFMDMIAPDRNRKHVPMKEVPEDVPVMALASISFVGKPALENSKIPFSQIAIELFTPLTGGIHIGGGFSPDAFRELRRELHVQPKGQ
jgi:hypothetical protein